MLAAVFGHVGEALCLPETPTHDTAALVFSIMSKGPTLVVDDPNVIPLEVGDALINLTTGMGTGRDPSVANDFRLSTRISRFEADALYLNDWLGARVVDAIPEDSVREWREITGLEPEQVTAFEEVEEEWDVPGKMAQAQKWARLYGGAGIIMGLDGTGEFHEPLDLKRVRPGSLKYLSVLDRWHLIPSAFNFHDPFRHDWGKPEHYFAYQGPDKIHRSRILFFYGTPLPYHLAIRHHFWGASVLERVYEAIANATTVQNGIAKLVTEAKVDVFKIPRLFDKLRTPQGTSEIMERLRLGNLSKSLWNSLLMDAGEDYEQKTGALTGRLPELVSQFLEVVAGASTIPVTVLLGTPAPGMNSTGESDIRNYYDRVGVVQKNALRPPLKVLDEVLMRTSVGDMPPSFGYKFKPLWQQSETERATVQNADADRDMKYLDGGIILEHHIADRLIEQETYPTLTEKDSKALEQSELAFGEEPDLPFGAIPPLLPAAGKGAPPAVPPGRGTDPEDETTEN